MRIDAARQDGDAGKLVQRHCQVECQSATIRKWNQPVEVITVGHSPRPATGAETAAFTTERHQFLIVTGLTANPEKAILKSAALQVLIKSPTNESGQVFAVVGQFGLKLGPVLLDDLMEQGRLGSVAYVSCSGVCSCLRR